MNDAIVLTLFFASIGLIIGFLAQRSRMCFVAGVRDYILVRDKELLIGLFSFLFTIWILTSIFYSLNILKIDMPQYCDSGNAVKQKIVEAKNSGFDLRSVRIIDLAEKNVNVSSLFNEFFYATVIGAFLIGLLSVFAGGCVLRQHVLCSQGNMDSLFYLIGFYAAVVIYYLFLSGFFSWIY
jgi:uncharacterized membrane protein YedE/YeeE